VGTFTVIGRRVASNVCIAARCDALPEAEALAQVIEHKPTDHAFGEPIEFEYAEYRVRCGSQRTVKLFARVPDVVQSDAEVLIVSDDPTSVGVRGKPRLVAVAGTNYALGEIHIHGKRLKSKAIIRATLNGHEAVTEAKVVERPEQMRGPSIKIKLEDEDWGNFRARWADYEGRPNVLLVAGRHQSLRRYLGNAREDGTFEGEDNPLYRVLLAEIVAEAVCRKSLQLEARTRSWDFQWANLKDDDKISDDVIAKLQQRLREFLPIAHREMVQERDAKQAIIIEPA
jgi:hypothetical protein